MTLEVGEGRVFLRGREPAVEGCDGESRFAESMLQMVDCRAKTREHNLFLVRAPHERDERGGLGRVADAVENRLQAADIVV